MKSARGTRLPSDWKPSVEQWNYASNLGFDANTIERIGLDFAAYWSEIPGQRGLKLTWNGTWQVWCRREADRRGMGRSAIKQHRETMIEIANDLAFGLGLTAAE